MKKSNTYFSNDLLNKLQESVWFSLCFIWAGEERKVGANSQDKHYKAYRTNQEQSRCMVLSWKIKITLMWECMGYPVRRCCWNWCSVNFTLIRKPCFRLHWQSSLRRQSVGTRTSPWERIPSPNFCPRFSFSQGLDFPRFTQHIAQGRSLQQDFTKPGLMQKKKKPTTTTKLDILHKG